FTRFYNRFDSRSSCGSIGYFLDYQCFFIQYFNLCANTDPTAPLALVILGEVRNTSRGEVGVYFRILTLEDVDRGFDEFAEVVRHDLGRQPDGDTFHALGEQERKLNG